MDISPVTQKKKKKKTRPTLGSSPPVIGGVGLGSAASPSVGGAASQPALKAHQSLWRQASIGNIGSHLPPPRVLPRLGSVHTPTQALQEMESRWTASIQADPTGRVRRRSDIPDSQPAWMSPSSGPRLHWSQRQQQQQEQHQQQQQQLQHAQQLPSDKAAINDTP